jgi:subtilisin family serine protease
VDASVVVESRAELRRLAGRGVTIAVVDSGWSADTPDVRVLAGHSVVGPAADSVGDDIGHGTLCASRILQVAPQTRVLPIKVFSRRLETSVDTLCRGITAAGDRGADVINVSMATELEDAIRPLFEVCEAARRHGIIIVASAHNRRVPAVPAYLEPVLSVQEGHQMDLLDFTYDPNGLIECTAATHSVPILMADGRTRPRSGSSIAAATMSGIVARLVEAGIRDLDAARGNLLALASNTVRPAISEKD